MSECAEYLRQRFSGEGVWAQRWSKRGTGRASGMTYYYERHLWQGRYVGVSGGNCSYCGNALVFYRYESKRPVPEGATDLGLSDPAAAWLCPACEQLVSPTRLIRGVEWPFIEGHLCHKCWEPFESGGELMVLATFERGKLREGSAYHPSCLPDGLRNKPPRIPLTAGERFAEYWDTVYYCGCVGCAVLILLGVLVLVLAYVLGN